MKGLQLSQTSTELPPKLQVTNLPVPQLQPGYALVQIRFASIQPSDRLNAQGGFPYTKFPRVPGRDYSGVVVDIADHSDEARSWIGKTVYGTSGLSLGFEVDGTHAQYCLIPQSALVEKPTVLSDFQAATVGVPFTTALLCIHRARVGANDVVLILGANGAVGSAAVQMAKAIGCKYVITAARHAASNPDVILSSDDPRTILGGGILALTNGKGVDVVIDTVGDLTLMSAAMEQLALNGRYAWITAPKGDVSKNLIFDVFQAYRKELSLLGCNSVTHSMEAMAEQLQSMHKWIEQGLLQAHKETDFATVKLEDAIEMGYGKTGQKVVIDMS
ncbi:uncharacterized protein N7459_009390 [Penicillium hispanicum]|uniref:uncharacterized protein n=1 Tax=Penicillium hispanicum TaxID=1080232 RepID=UPI002541CC49|nr:uncharacterized protein N7459_009390 [Penicillium hispanicum]KAJ5569960.1 hypothetical protein N7459_009390 [Penicillium hispanicum]